MSPTLFTLFALALLFAILELFLPGGISGTIGAVLFLIATVMVYNDYGFIAGTWTLIGGTAVAVAILITAFKLIPKTKLGKEVFHTADAKDWLAYEPELKELIGKTGTALTVLRPCGTVIIDGKRHDVITAGEMLPQHATVIVTAVEGNKIVVAQTTESKEVQTI